MAPVAAPGTIVADVRQYWRVYWLSIVASFGGMLFGWDTGLIGGVLTMPAFQKSFNLNDRSATFANLQGNIVSVLQAGCFFGAGASFFVSNYCGRRGGLFVALFFFLGGSVIQTCAGINSTDLGILYAGRVIGGIGVGMVSAIVPTYIGESANKEIRGRCIGCMQLFNVTGIMLAYFVNYGLNEQIPGDDPKKWRISFALQMIPGILLLLGLLTTKESPRWCVEKRKLDQARHILSHIRSKPIDDEAVMLEFKEIVDDFQGREQLSIGQQAKAIFESKKVFYPVTMSLLLQWFQQWSGTNSINYYSPQIFRSIGLSGQSAGLFATGIYGVVKVVMTAGALCLSVEQLGRKWSLAIGGFGQCFSMLYIGGHLATSGPTQSLDSATYFAIVCVYLYVAFYSMSWGFGPYILTSECSPNHVRSLVLAAALMLQWLCNFAIAKLTPIMLADITYGTYLVFGASCFMMAVFALVFVPEPKGVPQESIPLLFEGDIIKGALKDCVPQWQRAKILREVHLAARDVSSPSSENDADLATGNAKSATATTATSLGKNV